MFKIIKSQRDTFLELLPCLTLHVHVKTSVIVSTCKDFMIVQTYSEPQDRKYMLYFLAP